MGVTAGVFSARIGLLDGSSLFVASRVKGLWGYEAEMKELGRSSLCLTKSGVTGKPEKGRRKHKWHVCIGHISR